jgi:hypothetical protein
MKWPSVEFAGSDDTRLSSSGFDEVTYMISTGIREAMHPLEQMPREELSR